jgi:tetratricopeptide (TPR) repeat protein
MLTWNLWRKKSQRQQELLPEEKKLLKSNFYRYDLKAGIFTCLFYFFISFPSLGQQAPHQLKAFKHLLQLDYLQAKEVISVTSKKDAYDYYFLSLIATVELMVEQDRAKVENFLQNSTAYLKALESFDEEQSMIVSAEIDMHKAMVYALNEQEFYAALSFRQSFLKMKTALNKYPQNKNLYKTIGLQLILLGSGPEKYDWILSLLGMKGDVNKGLEYLKLSIEQDAPNNIEAMIWISLLNAYVLHGNNTSDDLYQQYHLDPQHKLLALLAGILSIKDAKSEKAIKLLKQTTMPLIASYHLGEALLHKGEYEKSLQAYQQYIHKTKSLNLINDALFKSGLCMLFLDRAIEAQDFFAKAKIEGKINTEADKYAASVLTKNEPINIPLQKLRYYTDGGYYTKAIDFLTIITPKDLPSTKDKVEYHYRKARLMHKTDSLDVAIQEYKTVIEKSGEEVWYFAANAALQLGYIFESKNDFELAAHYFNLALSYKKHEYKSSIDGKARSALSQLEGAK